MISPRKIEPNRKTTAQARDCKCNSCGFDYHNGRMKYLIFLFLLSGTKTKRGYEFSHSNTQCFENSTESVKWKVT